MPSDQDVYEGPILVMNPAGFGGEIQPGGSQSTPQSSRANS